MKNVNKPLGGEGNMHQIYLTLKGKKLLGERISKNVSVLHLLMFLCGFLFFHNELILVEESVTVRNTEDCDLCLQQVTPVTSSSLLLPGASPEPPPGTYSPTSGEPVL